MGQPEPPPCTSTGRTVRDARSIIIIVIGIPIIMTTTTTSLGGRCKIDVKKWHFFFSEIFRTRATCPVHIAYRIIRRYTSCSVYNIIRTLSYPEPPIVRRRPQSVPWGARMKDYTIIYYTRPPRYNRFQPPPPTINPSQCTTTLYYGAYNNNTNPGIRWRYVNTIIIILYLYTRVVKRGT